uniref:EF-hand domain-containing protein n=1 Tax=Caenorhabditis tropicalis TaxID=1561998 RepID=A0A1I7V1K6_9PELO
MDPNFLMALVQFKKQIPLLLPSRFYMNSNIVELQKEGEASAFQRVGQDPDIQSAIQADQASESSSYQAQGEGTSAETQQNSLSSIPDVEMKNQRKRKAPADWEQKEEETEVQQNQEIDDDQDEATTSLNQEVEDAAQKPIENNTAKQQQYADEQEGAASEEQEKESTSMQQGKEASNQLKSDVANQQEEDAAHQKQGADSNEQMEVVAHQKKEEATSQEDAVLQQQAARADKLRKALIQLEERRAAKQHQLMDNDADEDGKVLSSQEFKRRVEMLVAVLPAQSFKGMSFSEMAVWYYGYCPLYRDKKIRKIWKQMEANDREEWETRARAMDEEQKHQLELGLICKRKKE